MGRGGIEGGFRRDSRDERSVCSLEIREKSQRWHVVWRVALAEATGVGSSERTVLFALLALVSLLHFAGSLDWDS